MANKNNDAILMAILQDIEAALSGNVANSAASTAAIAMSDIKRGGADQNDIHNIAANSVFDQTGDIMSKIQYQFEQHPEILEELDKFADDNGLMQGISDNPLMELGELINAYLHKKRKYAEGGQFENNNNFVNVQIGNKVYNLLYLQSEDEKEQGLMNVSEMDPNEGALFDYSDDPQPELNFWMKNTTIPLDICFVNEAGKIISVHQGKPLSEDYITESSEFIAYVIELNANSGVRQGDQTSLGTEINEEIDDEEFEKTHPELSVNRLYVYDSNGEIQATLQGSERIFSRKSTRVLIRKAKKAFFSKEDKDYKALGKYLFNEMNAQDERPSEYVEQ